MREEDQFLFWKRKTFDRIVTVKFVVLSLLFIVLMAVSRPFFEWAFARHQNILSWYIRPLFMIPICYFAFKRSASGLSVTFFLLLTSMFWFPKPEAVDSNVQAFLAMERAYLMGTWTIQKIAVTSIVPISLGLLIGVLWKRNIKAGVGVVVAIAFAKIAWSLIEGGQSGSKIIVPALVGLALCLMAIYLWYKKSYRK
ncbi:MAG: hypothetical protein PWQ12_1885 [Clostridiales bacterium]|jgi:hypothetical protein|nr:hypothetical protein [Clostridiales bacterium]